MFGIPERRTSGNNTYFYVPMAKPVSLGVRLRMNKSLTIHPDPAVQPKFKDIQVKVLNELTKTETLFKNKPTYESLERITPQWGIIYDHTNTPHWNEYTQKEFLFEPKENLNSNSIVNLELIGILITRSSISPKFAVKFVENDDQNDVIDFDWQTPAKEIEEVADLEAATDAKTLTLRSPALIAKEKEDAKEHVKVLFRTADEARRIALDAMANFYGKYELSDDESQFSDWLTDDDEA